MGMHLQCSFGLLLFCFCFRFCFGFSGPSGASLGLCPWAQKGFLRPGFWCLYVEIPQLVLCVFSGVPEHGRHFLSLQDQSILRLLLILLLHPYSLFQPLTFVPSGEWDWPFIFMIISCIISGAYSCAWEDKQGKTGLCHLSGWKSYHNVFAKNLEIDL